MKKLFPVALAAAVLCALTARTAHADPCQSAASLPPGFIHETLVEFPETTVNTVKALPDGRLIIGLGDGRGYLMLNDGTIDKKEPFTDYDTVPYELNGTIIEKEAEGGLIGAAVSRDFATDRLFYTMGTTNRQGPGGRKFVLARFQAEPTGLSVVPNSRTVIWERADENQNTDYHSGGGLSIGADGSIFLGLGDDGNVSFPQSMTSWRGKLLRMNPDGSAPSDNPFYIPGDMTARNYIYALGLRNPYRNIFDTTRSERHLLSDTGQSLWEELNVTTAGANHGWTQIEGPIADNPGVTPPAGYTDPFFAYPHGGGAIEGVSIVSAAVCPGGNFPASFEGDYFVTEWGYFARPAKIFHLDVSPEGDILSKSVFHSDVKFGFGDIDFNSDGELVYTKANFLSNPATDTRGEVRRIRYTEPDASPTASAMASVTEGQAPLIVQFSSTVNDDNGTPAICWKFGDGGQSTAANPQKTYGNPGVYQVSLTAEDSFRSRATDTLTIRVYGMRDISLAGQLFDARTTTAVGLAGEIDFFQPDGITPLAVGQRGVVSTDMAGNFDGSFEHVQIFGTHILARFEAPGFVPQTLTVPIVEGVATLSGDVYLSSTAFVGTVSRENGAPVANNDVFLQESNGGGLLPYFIHGGIDFTAPLPPSGVPHGVLTNGVGEYYLPIRTADATRNFQLTANFQPNLTGHLSASADVVAPAKGTVTSDLTLVAISGTSDCDIVFPPAPLFPTYPEIQDIFSSHCIGCHGIVSPNAGLSLYPGFSYSSLVEIPSLEFPSKKFIDVTTSGDAVVNSWLVEKVRCSQPSVGSLMPPTGKLSGREINLIGEWARRGAPYTSPDTAIHASAAAVNSPAVVSFRGGARGPGAPFSFTWDFDDGMEGTGAAPSHMFIQLEGSHQYVVNMQARKMDGSLHDEISVPVTVTAPAPTPGNEAPYAIVEPIDPVEAGTMVLLDAALSFDSDGEIVAYLWDTDNDGAFDARTTTPALTVTFEDDGFHLVGLTVVDNQNAASTALIGVSVGDLATADVWTLY